MEEQSRTYILEASDLSVSFETDAGEVQAVRDVSLSLKEGEVLAIVGESGCGKSVLCKSLMKILPGNARIKSGKMESILPGTKSVTWRNCVERFFPWYFRIR